MSLLILLSLQDGFCRKNNCFGKMARALRDECDAEVLCAVCSHDHDYCCGISSP